MRREDELPSIFRCPNRFDDFIDDLVVEILLWLIDDQWSVRLIHQDIEKCRCLLALRSLPEFYWISVTDMEDLYAGTKN